MTNKLTFIFETASIRSELHFQSLRFRRFREQHNNPDVAIAQVVIDEINAHLSHHDEKRIAELEKAATLLRKHVSNIENHPLKAPLEQLSFSYQSHEERLTQTYQHLCKLTGAEIRVLPYPTIPHQDVVRRCLSEIRPFKRAGLEKDKKLYSDTGYRDTLIWHSVLEELVRTPSNTIVFLSDNSKDFADGKKKLHSDLIKDLEAVNISQERILYFASFDNMLDMLQLPPTISTTKPPMIVVPEAVVDIIGSKSMYDVLLEALLDRLELIDDTHSDDNYVVRSGYDEFIFLSKDDQMVAQQINGSEVLFNATFCGLLVVDVYKQSHDYRVRRTFQSDIIEVEILFDITDHCILGASVLKVETEPVYPCFIRTVPLDDESLSALIVEPKELLEQARELKFESYEKFKTSVLQFRAESKAITSKGSAAINVFHAPAAPRSLLIRYGFVNPDFHTEVEPTWSDET